MSFLILKLARSNPKFRRRLIAENGILTIPVSEENENWLRFNRKKETKKEAKDKKEEEFRRFWKEVYEGGKKKVKNPNPKGRKAEVTANTAMKDKSFQNHVYKEYKQWKSKNEDKEDLEESKFDVEWEWGEDNAKKDLLEIKKKVPFFKGKDVMSTCLELCGLQPVAEDETIKINFIKLNEEGSVSITISSDTIVEMDREISFDQKGNPDTIYNSSFIIDEYEQGKGIGTKVFSSQVQEAKKYGFKDLETYAAGSGKVGYYVWPLLGYDHSLEDIEATERLKKDLKPWVKKIKKKNLPLTIRSLFLLPGGIEWWRNRGDSLPNAKFDLSSDSESLKILNAYLEKKGMEKIAKKKEKLKKGWSDAPILDEDIINQVWEELQVK